METGGSATELLLIFKIYTTPAELYASPQQRKFDTITILGKRGKQNSHPRLQLLLGRRALFYTGYTVLDFQNDT